MTKDNKVLLFFPRLEPDKEFHWFPLGPLSVAGPLLKKGFDVSIIDERITPEYKGMLSDALENCLCVGISSFSGFQLSGALEFARQIRDITTEIPLVFGGPHVTALPKESIRSKYVDACVLGYNDWTLTELAICLKQGRMAFGIDNLIWKDRKGNVYFQQSKKRKPGNEEWCVLPYHLIDVPKYINPETKAIMYLSSYGCPGRCTFCATPETRKWRAISLERIKTDLVRVSERYGFEHLVMYDAAFFSNKEYSKKIPEWLSRHEYFKTWECNGRALDLERFDRLFWEFLLETGLKGIGVGLESGSERIVNFFKKGKKHLERYKRVVSALADYDIVISSGVIFGAPTETIDDLKNTLQFLQEAKELNPNIQFSTYSYFALPGTELFDYIRKHYDNRLILFPQSLEEWAEKSKEDTALVLKHNQNQIVPNLPYIDRSIVDEYSQIYTRFWERNQNLLSTDT